MKAIHNSASSGAVSPTLFSKSKSTKNESNSQQTSVFSLLIDCCFQRAKVRKMKAIHNETKQTNPKQTAVFKEQKYEK